MLDKPDLVPEFSIAPGVYSVVVRVSNLAQTGFMDVNVDIFPLPDGTYACQRNRRVTTYPQVHIRTMLGEGYGEIIEIAQRFNITDDPEFEAE